MCTLRYASSHLSVCLFSQSSVCVSGSLMLLQINLMDVPIHLPGSLGIVQLFTHQSSSVPPWVHA